MHCRLCPHAFIHCPYNRGEHEVDKDPVYVRFRNALEQGIRNVAISKSRLFRTNSIKTRTNWHNTDLWRKHKCALFLTRMIHKSPNYQYFHNFRMSDYLQRSRVIKTYNIRHGEMTRGLTGTYDLGDPEDWSSEPPAPAASASAISLSARFFRCSFSF